MASCGVTRKNARHVVAMARFARAALNKFNELVSSELAISLGPDTGDLGMRFGIHSGPVTAGKQRRVVYQAMTNVLLRCLAR